MKFKDLIKNAFVDEHERNPDYKPHAPIQRQLLDRYKGYQKVSDFQNIYLTTKENLYDFLLWPPNAFVVCAKFLDITGVYKRITANIKENPWTEENIATVKRLGQQWSHFCLSDMKENILPDAELLDLIYRIFRPANAKMILSDLIEEPKFVTELLTLLLAADESFKDIDSIDDNNEEMLNSNSIGDKHTAVQLKKINPASEDFNLSNSQKSYGTVHYKHFVCQSGISLNGLSHHLAYIKPDIVVKYIQKRAEPVDSTEFNLLIFPWPKTIADDCFSQVTDQTALAMTDKFGFFEYTDDTPFDFDAVITTIAKAQQQGDEVDLVIFPECAMSTDNAQTLADRLYSHYQDRNILANCPTLVTGTFQKSVRAPQPPKKGDLGQYGVNALSVFYASQCQDDDSVMEPKSAEQKKHHRWFLDKGQIDNYKLADVLPTEYLDNGETKDDKKWWEYIEVSHRSLITYYCEKHDYQMSPLICEDLARQDPVAPVVRALGPSLIVALLLDGPQLSSRWSGRYASILADDPGSGVLSVTPLGMTLRSDGTGFGPSTVVALWSEPHKTVELALSLAPQAEAVMLTLNKSEVKQWTADGRMAKRNAFTYARHASI